MTAAPLGGARMMDNCRLHADSKDDVFSMGVRVLMDRPGMCCARLDDFDWVVPHYDPDTLLSGRDMDVRVEDINRDNRVLPDAFPAMFDKTVAVPMTLPVDVEMGPHVDDDPDVMLTGREVEVSDTDVGRDIRVLMDGCPSMFEESATVPLSLPVVVNTETQVDVRWETTSAMFPFGDGCGRPAGWLDSESDCCVMDEIALVLEMSPIVSMKSAVVPTYLPALSEVFSLAVLAGGSLLRQPPWPW